LQVGFFHPILMDDEWGIYVFERELGNHRVYVFLNRSAADRHVRAQLEEGVSGGMVDWLDPASAELTPTSTAGDGRPELTRRPAVEPTGTSINGTVDVDLKPWATRVFSNYLN
jgi:hypothetical protein